MKKKLLNFILVASLPIATNGCEYNINTKYSPLKTCLHSIDEDVAKYEKENGENLQSVNIKVLRKYFTDEAFEKLKGIPVEYGDPLYENHTAYAGGRNFFMNVFQSIVGYGWGKKTVMTYDRFKYGTHDMYFVHENIHHASAIELIDDEEFEKAWNKLKNDLWYYQHITVLVDAKISEYHNDFLLSVIPLWRTVEREAYLAEIFIFNNRLVIKTDSENMIIKELKMPDYLRKVYERTLK